MIRTNLKITLAVSVAISTTFLPGTASAELYVSPIVKNEVKPETKKAGLPGLVILNEVTTQDSSSGKNENVIIIKKEAADGSVSETTVKSDRYESEDLVVEMENRKKLTNELKKKSLLKQKIELKNASFSEEQLKPFSSDPFGRDVPLKVALDNVIPLDEDYIIHIEEGLEDKNVSWEGGDSWELVLDKIAEANDIFIFINKDEKAIGVSKSERLAPHYAHKISHIWKIDKSMSLRGNLASWASKAGWRLAWDKDLHVDYPIQFDGVVVGGFHGQDGVVAKILQAFADRKVSLKAVFFKQNKVLLIKQAGFTHKGNQ